VAFALPAQAQTFFDNFDSYAAGSGIIGQGGWQGWAGGTSSNAFVSNAQSYSSPNSLGVSGAADVVQTWGGITSGLWYAKAWTYVPSTQTGEMWFILMNTYDGACAVAADCDWSIQVVLCNTGCTTTGGNPPSPGFVTNYGAQTLPGAGAAALLTDQWVEVIAEINLDANSYTVYYNGAPFDTQQYYDPATGQQAIQAMDLYSNGSSESYMDNVWLDTNIPVELQTIDIE